MTTVDKFESYNPTGIGFGHLNYYRKEHITKILKCLKDPIPDTSIQLATFNRKTEKHEEILRSRIYAAWRELDNAAEVYSINHSHDQKPSPSEVVRKFKQVQKASKRLLDYLGVSAESLTENDIERAIDQIPYGLKVPLEIAANKFAGDLPTGYPAHPRESWSIHGETYPDNRGDLQLKETLRGLLYLQAWAKFIATDVKQEFTDSNSRHSGNPHLNELLKKFEHVWSVILGQEKRLTVATEVSGREGEVSGPLIDFIKASLSPLEITLDAKAIRSRLRRIRDG